MNNAPACYKGELQSNPPLPPSQLLSPGLCQVCPPWVVYIRAAEHNNQRLFFLSIATHRLLFAVELCHSMQLWYACVKCARHVADETRRFSVQLVWYTGQSQCSRETVELGMCIKSQAYWFPVWSACALHSCFTEKLLSYMSCVYSVLSLAFRRFYSTHLCCYLCVD